MEMKAKYYFKVTFEFLKFCKCTDFTSEVEKLFMGDVSNVNEHDLDFMEDNIEATQDPMEVARALVNLSKYDQIKAYFGGLAETMCAGAEDYIEQVENWEKQYHFLQRLM